MSANAEPRLLTVAEVAAHYRVSVSTVYRWIAEGRLEVVRTPGGTPRVPVSAVPNVLNLTVR